jgi:transposase
MSFVAGVDTHKDSHAIVFVSTTGESVVKLTVPASAVGYRQAVEAAQKFEDVIWGIEGTGSYGRGLAETLVAQGYVVYEVPGSFTKRERRLGSRPGKSDALDARAIADVVLREAGRLPRFQESDQQEAIRLHYDRRDRYVRLRTEATNRLRAAALRLSLDSLPSNLATEKALKTVETRLRSMTLSSYTAHALADEIRDACAEIRSLNERITTIARYLRPFVMRLAPELLAMHGISTVIAAGIIGHAGNLSNYRDAAAFAMRTGTAPIPCSSGRKTAMRVNPGGDRQLNRCLHTIALSQSHKAGHPGRAYYERKRAEGKDHLAALRSLKRQLATITYYKLKDVHRRLDAASQALPAPLRTTRSVAAVKGRAAA